MKLPLVPTIIVALAVAVMIALGVWQLGRADEKAALLATLAANPGKPPVTMPRLGPVPPELLFRRAEAMCLEVTGWRSASGRGSGGVSGYRRIAECRTGAEGPGLLVDMGVTRDFRAEPGWRGGPVRGSISTEPDTASVIVRAFGGGGVLRPMLVADTPAPGLSASAVPTPASVANNHLSYAVQWFLFAAIAIVIYLLALRRRARSAR